MPNSAVDFPVRPGRARELPTFLLALLLGVGIYLGGLALFRWPAEPDAPTREAAPFVHYVPADTATQAEVNHDQAIFADPQLLYMFTPRNVAPQAATAPATQPQAAVQPYDLQPATEDVNLGMKNQLSVAPAKTPAPAEALKPEPWEALETMGQSPNSSTPLPARGARLRIVRQQTGAAAAGDVREITWPAAMAPDAGDALWQPAIFSLIFNAAGLVGEPQLGSNFSVAKVDENPKVDEDLRKKLEAYFRLYPLPQGYYTIEIGP